MTAKKESRTRSAPNGATSPPLLLPVRKQNLFGAIDPTGMLRIAFRFESLAEIRHGIGRYEERGLYGFVDAKGHTVIQPRYPMAYDFNEGFALIRVKDLYGYIDPKGIEVVRPKYADASPFSEGLARVQETDTSGVGFLDHTGSWAIEPMFRDVHPFTDGLAAARVEGGWGFIDHQGEWALEPRFTLAYEFREGLAAVSVDSKAERIGFINRTGEYIIEATFNGADVRFSEGLAAVFKDGRYGFIDTLGALVIPYMFADTGVFSNGLCRVTTQGRRPKDGFIDKTGQYVIDPVYDRAGEFECGVACVAVGDRFGYVDKSGNWIWKPS